MLTGVMLDVDHTHLSMDEVRVSRGELNTVLTNKYAKGRKWILVAIVGNTKTDDIVMHVSRIPSRIREKVREVILDLAENMSAAVKELFPITKTTAERFHVENLAHEMVQYLRVELRWQTIKKSVQTGQSGWFTL